MAIIFDIPDSFTSLLDSASIEKSVIATLQHQGASLESDLSIVFVDNPKIQAFNREYRQVDAVTDVLAFPAGFIDPDSQQTYLGDVIISYPQARVQAGLSNHSVNDEIHLLVVHGVLHLLGHDHLEEKDKEEMWLAQKQILNQQELDLSLPE
jgi:probable rRNA maturation factor